MLIGLQRFAAGRPKHTLKHLQDAAEIANSEAEMAQVGEEVAAEPEPYELHHQDETHLDTNPHLCRMYHRIGQQPTLPAAGANRHITTFGSVELLGRGSVEVVCAGHDSACFLRYLAALDARHPANRAGDLPGAGSCFCHARRSARRR